MEEDIQGFPEITHLDAHRVVQGLTVMTTYLSTDLYRRYQAQCSRDGRDPVHPVTFGRMLRRIGCNRRKKGTGSKAQAAWIVTDAAKDPRWADGTWP